MHQVKHLSIEFTLLWTRVNFECLMAHLFKAVNRARFLGGFTDCSGDGLFVVGSFEELTYVLLFVSAGCMYKNNLYQHGQSWNDGCDYKCTCKDGVSGRYECTTRSSLHFYVFSPVETKTKEAILHFWYLRVYLGQWLRFKRHLGASGLWWKCGNRMFYPTLQTKLLQNVSFVF